MERSWVAHYDPGVPAQLDYPSLTLPQLFDASAAENSGRAATIFHGARLTYGQLKGQIDRFAGGLRRLGIVPGDRVAIDLPNLPQFVVAFYGTLRAGAVAVPTNPLYTQHELAYQLADSGARAVVTLDRLFPTLQAALPETRVQTVVVTDVAAALPRHLRLLGRLHQRREGIRRIPSGGIVHRFERVLTSPPAECSATDVDALAVLQYTGGTTGTSKGAMLSHRNMVTNVVQVDAWQGKVRGGSILCGIPFFHVYGLTVAMNIAVVSGATMLLLPRFIPAEAAQMAARYHPGLFPGVPTMYVALAGLSDFSAQQFGSLRACISGAAPLPLEVQRRFLEASGAHVVEGYG
ncbi:MAG: AMP-binding protein, partial [Chloroflexota bacterium]